LDSEKQKSFFQTGLDSQMTEQMTDLPVGQITCGNRQSRDRYSGIRSGLDVVRRLIESDRPLIAAHANTTGAMVVTIDEFSVYRLT
jgi:hypothetical protein